MHPNLSVIRKRRDFLAANRGLRVARPGFVLLARPNDGQGKRYGITVTKKIGNAVVRNRMKRRFRELLWAALPPLGVYVLPWGALEWLGLPPLGPCLLAWIAPIWWVIAMCRCADWSAVTMPSTTCASIIRIIAVKARRMYLFEDLRARR